MKTIIIATDFSNAAINAANYGVKLAEALDAEILLVNIFEVLPNYGEFTFDVNVDNLTKEVDIEIEQLKNELSKNTTVNIKTSIRLGVFVNELTTLCNETNPYFVILGSQGKTAAERFFLGSHVLKAIHSISFPILAIPPKVIFKEIYRIGIAYDFDTEIDQVLIEQIKRTAGDFNAGIHILNFENKNAFDAEYVLKSNNLERSLKPFEIKYHFVASDTINKSIIDFVDNNYINLLVIMPKEHSFIEKIFTSSHSKELVLHSHVPILSLRK